MVAPHIKRRRKAAAEAVAQDTAKPVEQAAKPPALPEKKVEKKIPAPPKKEVAKRMFYRKKED